MFEKSARWTANLLVTHRIIAAEDCEIYRFGLESGMLKVAHYMTMLLLGALLSMLPETILFLVAYGMIRTYGGGYHADTRGVCYFLSWVTILSILMIARFCPDAAVMAVSILLLVFAFPIIFLKAPVDNQTKPLDEDECRYYKKRARIMLVVLTGAALLLNLLFLGKFGLVVAECLGLEALMMLLGRWKNGKQTSN